MRTEGQRRIPVNVLVQFCGLTLHSRALHNGGVPLGLKTTGLLLCALRLPLLTAGSLAKSRQAGESCALFPPGSDRMGSPGAGCVSLCLATQETGITSGPPLGSGRRREAHPGNDDQLTSPGGTLASCSSGERNLKLGPSTV